MSVGGLAMAVIVEVARMRKLSIIATRVLTVSLARKRDIVFDVQVR